MSFDPVTFLRIVGLSSVFYVLLLGGVHLLEYAFGLDLSGSQKFAAVMGVYALMLAASIQRKL